MAGTYVGMYDTTAANNTATGTSSVSIAEGMAPSNINNAMRDIMADIRQWYNAAEWIEYGDGAGTYTPAYASGTSFTIASVDVTAAYHVGRRVKAVGSSTGTIYGSITATSFSTNTTITVSWDSGSLSSETLKIYIGIVSASNTSLPETTAITGDYTLDVSGDIILDADGDDVLLKAGGTQYGTLTNSSSNLLIKSGSTTAATFSGANVTLAGTVASGAITSSGIVKTDDTTEATTTTDGSLQTDGGLSIAKDAVFGDDVKLLSDSAVLSFGADSDTTLTHTDGTGLILNSTNKLTFQDTGTYVGSNADGDLDVVSDGTAVDSINIESAGGITLDAGTASSGIIYEDDGTAMLSIINSSSDVILTTKVQDKDFIIKGDDGGVAITALTLDMSAAGAATFNDKVIATELDISGNMDIDGTSNLDAVDIDGAVQLDATFTVGADDQGYDVKLFGDTASASMLWDTSADDLILAGAARIVVPDSGLVLGSTAVTTTAAEINLIDGGASTGTTAVADADGILTNDGGTMRLTTAATFKTYFQSGVTASSLAADDISAGDNTVSVATSSGNVTIDSNAGAAKVDGHTGVEITSTNSGNVTLDSITGIIDIQDSGSSVLSITEGNSGDVTVKLVTNGKDLIFTDNGDATGLKVLDAAAGINVPGEVQTTGLAYTDGDDAITIADGGGVTFGATLKVIDDKTLTFGSNDDWTIEYDENGDDDLVLTGSDISVESGTSEKPILQLLNTNNDANGSTIKFNKNGGNVADNDVIGNLDFVSEDDGDNVHTYARIRGTVVDMTGGQEEGSIQFYVAEYDGTLTKGMDIVGLGSDGNITVDISTHDGAAGGLKLGGTLVTSTAAELNKLDGAGTIAEAGTQTIWVPSNAMTPTASNPCADIAAVETTSGRPDMYVLDFDKDSDEHAQFTVAFPKSWDAGTVTFQVFWSGTANTGGVSWGLQGVAFANNDSIDTAYGTAVVVDDTEQGAIEEVNVSAVSGAITIAGSPGDDELCYFRIFRDVSDSNDDSSGDARLHGIKLFFTTDAANDAQEILNERF